MEYTLFLEINKFEDWAIAYLDIPQDNRSGEWELDYSDWQTIYECFEEFMRSAPVSSWSLEEIQRLLYIIARDNECERLVEELSDEALIRLSEHALVHGERDSKWQLANALPRIADKERAIDLIEQFVNDPEEYVNRRALMALAMCDAIKAEVYCKKHWDRAIYGEMDEYQRIMILHCLKQISSPSLRHYLELAKNDGRPHLVENAVHLEGEILGTSKA